MFIVFAGVALVSCKEDKLNDEVVIGKNYYQTTPFDEWLQVNFQARYNISVIWRWNDGVSDFTYALIPADYQKSWDLCKALKHMWLEAYDECYGSPDFIREYCPKQLFMMGTGKFKTNGSMVLGEAEGGIMVYLAQVNGFNKNSPSSITQDYLHTMHHEFAHILHQTKPYPKQDWDVISAGSYQREGWLDISSADAAQLGFVTPYASSAEQEDFVEVISRYLTQTDSWWEDLYNSAGTEGSSKINQKLVIVKTWLTEKFGIDLDTLRSIVRRRATETATIYN